MFLLPGQCQTTGGDDPNKQCIFPWRYNNEPTLYYGCANPDNSAGNWCPTGLTDGKYISGSGKWGFCNMALPGCKHGKFEGFLIKLRHIPEVVEAIRNVRNQSLFNGSFPPEGCLYLS